MHGVGCRPFCDVAAVLFVRGRVLDTETLEGLSNASVGGRAFTNGEETDYVAPFIFDGSPTFPPPAEDGTFGVEFSTPLMPCQDPPPEFPRPDQVEVIVVRDGCEQQFMIDISDDTVVDMDFPDDVIELKDPILVPPCED